MTFDLIHCLQITFQVEINEDVSDYRDISVEVKGPSGKMDCRLNTSGTICKGTFMASEIGIHEVVVRYQGEPVVGSPLKCRVLPQQSEVSYKPSGLAPCAVGSIVEVLVNPQDASPSGAKLEFLEVVAVSPSGNEKLCEVTGVDGGFAATFKPDEPGEWKVTVLYKGKDIQGSPFPCFVYDPNGVVVRNKYFFYCDLFTPATGLLNHPTDLVLPQNTPFRMHTFSCIHIIDILTCMI